MNAILVTGASGFVGKRLVKKLIEHYSREQIFCMAHDAHTELEVKGFEYIESLGVKCNRVDLVTGKGLDSPPKNLNIVFHLAASTHTEDRDHRCNDIGTANLLRYLDSATAPLHIIFTSTMAVYDDRKNFDEPINEDSVYKLTPNSEYGRTKLQAEEVLKQVCVAKGFGLTILRLATVYGKGVRSKGMFDSLHRMMQQNSLIPRLNWPAKIALVHVNDCVDALCQLAKQNQVNNEPMTYVMATENLTLSEISSNIYQASQKDYKLIKLPLLFWSLIAICTREKKWFEGVLPHKVYNKLWQLDLVVSSHMFSHGAKLKSSLPGWGNRKFNESAHELF